VDAKSLKTNLTELFQQITERKDPKKGWDREKTKTPNNTKGRPGHDNLKGVCKTQGSLAGTVLGGEKSASVRLEDQKKISPKD